MFLWLNTSFSKRLTLPKMKSAEKHKYTDPWGEETAVFIYAFWTSGCLQDGYKLVFQFVLFLLDITGIKCSVQEEINLFLWCDKQKRQSDSDALKKAFAINRKDVKQSWHPIILSAGYVFFAYFWSMFCI